MIGHIGVVNSLCKLEVFRIRSVASPGPRVLVKKSTLQPAEGDDVSI